jgi:hypothetical protein
MSFRGFPSALNKDANEHRYVPAPLTPPAPLMIRNGRGQYSGEVPPELVAQVAGSGTNCIVKFVWEME